MENDKKVSFVINMSNCEKHEAGSGVPCWSFAARGESNSRIMGVCMPRAARSGILLPKVRQQVLKAA